MDFVSYFEGRDLTLEFYQNLQRRGVLQYRVEYDLKRNGQTVTIAHYLKPQDAVDEVPSGQTIVHRLFTDRLLFGENLSASGNVFATREVAIRIYTQLADTSWTEEGKGLLKGTATNPVPQAPTFTLEPAINSALVTIAFETAPDIQGYLVRHSADASMTSFEELRLAKQSTFELSFTGTKSVQIAAFDSFGDDGLDWSEAKSVTALQVMDLVDLSGVTQQIGAVDEKLNEARQNLEAADAQARSLIQNANDHAASELALARTEITTQVQNARDAASESDILLNDAISGKANVVDFNLIKDEVTGARGTQTTLAARLTATENAVDGKATIASLDTLTSRVSSTETTTTAHNTRLDKVETDVEGKASAQSLVDLQARVNGTESQNAAQNTRLDTVESDVSGKASSTSVALLEAKSTSMPNLLPNGDFTVGAGGLEGWSTNVGGHTGLTAYDHKTLGRILNVNDQCEWAESAPVPFEAGGKLSFSLQCEGGGGDGYCYVQFLPSYTASQFLPLTSPSWENRKSLHAGGEAPPGTTAFRFIVVRGTAPGVHVARIKVNYENTATNWSDEATQSLAQARLSTVEKVTTDGTFASAVRVSDLEATTQTGPNRNSLLSSRLSTVETATTDGRFATANRVNALELQARAFPNLVRNSDFASGFRFWSNEGNRWITGTNAAWGSVAVCQNSHANDSYLISDPIYVYHSNSYTLSYYSEGGTAFESQSNAVYLACFDGNNTLIADGVAYARADVRDFSIRREASALIPAGTAYVKVVVRQAQGGSGMHVTRIMLNVGTTAQAWNDTATVMDTAARIRSVETITSDGTFATSTRASTLEAQLAGNQNSNLLSRLQTVETATTDGRFSTASRVSQLEVRNNQAINKNADFAVTPVAGQLPQGWIDWGSGSDLVPTSGQVSANAVQWTVAAASDKGIRQDISELSPGWYVLEATVTLVSGSLRGAGVLLQIADSSANEIGHDNISFKVESDTAKVVNGDGEAGRTYRFTKIVDARDNRTRTARLYAMAGWTAFDAQTAAKTITFHEVRLRRANAAEIETGLVRDNGGLAARLLATETATTDGRFSSATRTSTLEAQLAGNHPSNLVSRIGNLETATTDGRFATASRVSDLEARGLQLPNLVLNSDFSAGKRGWSNHGNPESWGINYNPGIGSFAGRYAREATPYYLVSDNFVIEPNNHYSLSFQADGGDGVGSNDGTAVYMTLYNAQGEGVTDGFLYTPVNSRDWAVRQKFEGGVSHQDARSARLVVRKGSQTDGLGITRIMVNTGSRAVDWIDSATTRDGLARIGSLETATTDGRFASAQRASTLEAQLRGDQASNLLGRIQTVETATSDGRFANASRVTALEARTDVTPVSHPAITRVLG